jgi:2-methylisocitrate lyase-like PEP mutase family enzyme
MSVMLRNAPQRLRELMKSEPLVWAPGVYDGYSARIANAVGFPALYMTGAGTTGSRLGLPDLGLVTLTEMVENARNIASVSDVPLIADADTGFGGPANVARTVHLFEQAGVAAIHIEDQTFPKRCGHLQGKAVASIEEFTQRIRAAARERYDPDFVIIARTDARAVNGFDDAMERIERAFDAGADVGFFEAPESLDEVKAVIERAPGPMLLNLSANGRTPNLRVDEVRELGFRMAIWPGALSRAAIVAMKRAAAAFKETGSDLESSGGLSARDVFEIVGLSEVIAIDARAGSQSLGSV